MDSFMDFQEPWSSMALLVLFYEKKGLNPSSPTCENWTIKKKKKNLQLCNYLSKREREREREKEEALNEVVNSNMEVNGN